MSPATTQTAPITAQNVLPVIDDPWMRDVPWPIQTRPVRQSNTPTARLRMTMEMTTGAFGSWFGARSAHSRDEHVLEVLARPPAGAPVDMPAQPGLEPEASAIEDLRIEVAPVVDNDEDRPTWPHSGRGTLEDRCDAGAVGLERGK